MAGFIPLNKAAISLGHLFCVFSLVLIMPAQAVEGFRADVVLNAAGILKGGLLANPHPDENFRQTVVAAVSLFSNLATFRRKGDMFVIVQLQVAVSSKPFDLLADGWAGELHLTGDVDGADIPIFLLKDEDRLEVHLSGFL